jgi:YD repeat-containing protein
MLNLHQKPSPPVRYLSLALCVVVIITSLLFPVRNIPPLKVSAQGSTGVPPQPGTPGAKLPDLSEARVLQPSEPETLPDIPSTPACEDCVPCPTCNSNLAPTSNPGDAYEGIVGQPVVFDASASFDPEGKTLTYLWNFGDGSQPQVAGVATTHLFSAQGTYHASLTVTDPGGLTATTTTTVDVSASPSLSVPPPTGSLFDAATFVSQSVPLEVTSGRAYKVSVKMKNAGTTTWTGAHLYRLGAWNPQDNTIWGVGRAMLPRAAAPGEEVTFDFLVVAPPGAAWNPEGGGTIYNFQWRMVKDSVEGASNWFGEPSANISVTSFDAYTPVLIDNYEPQNHFAARLEPHNRTGSAGEDLFSGNYNWTVPILGLRGRAGLDLGLSLTYNSLVWTRLMRAVIFDADRGFPGPGFRLGFPTIQQKFFNDQASTSSFLMITPSGRRVELRQTDVASVYEAVDSSYLQLTEDAGGQALLVRATDGTQMTYMLINGEYRCTSIKDGNGNYITINYTTTGHLNSITDTVGREITFHYDANQRLLAIKQARAGGVVHTWASFGYLNKVISTNFGDQTGALALSGVQQGSTVALLATIGLDDGSRYDFDYTSWGQVSAIKHHAADGHLLARTTYNLPHDASLQQSDCPRFTARRDWVESWLGDTDGIPASNEEAVTSFNFSPGGNSVTTPDGTLHRLHYALDSLDWRRGLVLQEETYPTGSLTDLPARRTVNTWTQDNTTATYPLNPRLTSNVIFETGGRSRRVDIEYTSFGLPSDVYEYDGATVVRRTHTDYELLELYTSRRLVGLVKESYVFGRDAATNAEKLYSKVIFGYDAGGEFLQHQGEPVQHDAAYSMGFVQGRGLQTSVSRWDATDENNSAAAVTSHTGYNTTGSPVFVRDPLGSSTRQTVISYTDAFSDSGSYPLTLAYPTSVTNRGGFSSTAKYDYHLGVNTHVTDPKGAQRKTDYDSAGRVRQMSVLVNNSLHSYTRRVYPASMTYVSQFTTVNDLAAANEAFSVTVFDGAGRVRGTARDFPGSVGGYSATYTTYDVSGQVVRQSNPAEVDHTWTASGDDAAGWLYTLQTYDWKGRPLVTTNTDGTTREVLYDGCGCAGSDIIVMRDEVGRRRRMTHDVLGRVSKAQVLTVQPKTDSLSAGEDSDVYSTTTYTYNALDQALEIKAQSGISGTAQVTTIAYDGHGRPASEHRPQQDAGKATLYEYNLDDTVHKVTDARGATTTLAYNSRNLVESITYGVPPSPTVPVQPSASVTFGYDEAGNRTWMEDGQGRVDYIYDALSRMTSETRQFNVVAPPAPEPTPTPDPFPGPTPDPTPGCDTCIVGSITAQPFTLSYSYNLAGELKSLTDAAGVRIDYQYDKAGQLTGVGGSGTLYGGVSQYVSGIKYRAWGAAKELTYGNSRVTKFDYNARLQTKQFKVEPVPQAGATSAMLRNYQYHPDGSVKFVGDEINHNFDRAYSFDLAGRVQEAYTGAQARDFINGTTGGATDSPYRQSYQYDALNNLRSRTGRFWSKTSNYTENYDEATNRSTNSQWAYDAAGNVVRDADMSYGFDASGRNYKTVSADGVQTFTVGRDGDGQVVSREDKRLGLTPGQATTYYVRSTVLGGNIVSEIVSTGFRKGYVYAGGELIAEQATDDVLWRHRDPLMGTLASSTGNGLLWRTAELDATGANVGMEDPFVQREGDGDSGFPRDPNHALLGESRRRPGETACYVDGAQEMECARVAFGLDTGAFRPCPGNDCDAPRLVTVETIGENGQVVGSTSVLRRAGQAGWDGSLDGTYSVLNSSAVTFNGSAVVVNAMLDALRPSGVTEFANGYGNGQVAVQRLSGSGSYGRAFSFVPQNPAEQLGRARELSRECSILVMLDVIATAEGNTGYDQIVRGTITDSPLNPNLVGQSSRDFRITDFSQHPQISVRARAGLQPSTAAGRYQITYGTWQDFGVGLPDFSPASQDLVAIRIMMSMRMTEPLLNGNFRQAADLAKRRWESFQERPHGRPARYSIDDLEAMYRRGVWSCFERRNNFLRGRRR